MSASSKKKLRKEQYTAQLTEKQLNEQKAANKLKLYTTVFLSVIALVVIVAVTVFGITSYNNSGIHERDTDAIVLGEHTLTGAELNYFYVDVIREAYTEWYNQYGDYTDMYISWIFGLDVNSPLDEQQFDENQTFSEYFTDLAVEDAKTMYAIYDEAIAKGHTLTEDEQNDIDELIDVYKEIAKANSISYKRYLKLAYGKGARKDTFRNYLEVLTLVRSYQTKYHDGLTYSEEDLKAYSEEHFDEFSSFSYISFLVSSSKFLTGGTKQDDGTTVYSDKEQADALAAAEEAAKTLVASGATNSLTLDAAINELEVYKDTTTTSSETNDALYSSINEEIAMWLAADDRAEGDLGYVKHISVTTDADGNETETHDGYYVVLMLGRNDNNMNLVNVRHILVELTGGTTELDGTTVYTDEEKAEAKAKLEAIQAEWLASEKTSESFGELASAKTEDSGSKSNGGLYENVHPGEMVEEFDAWIFDSSRTAGDYGIIETEYGYHLMYFVGNTDETYRNHMVEDTLRESDYTAWFDGLVNAASADVLDDSLVDHDFIIAERLSY